MTIRTILVHLHDPARADRLLAVAVPLARQHNAHVIALNVAPPLVTVPAMENIGAPVTLDEHRVAYRHDTDDLRAKVSSIAQEGSAHIEWREADAAIASFAQVLMDQSRTCDLVVISQLKPDWGYSTLLEEPERIAIECGRPVLIVPNDGALAMPPQRVLIAWNGTRESARAAFDAVPLLKSGTHITVLAIDMTATVASSARALCESLARYDFTCDVVEVRTHDGNVGAAIRNAAAAHKADLVVMGAYGHSRLREFVLGGASRDVFARMGHPVLMSH